ncbi:hypothetical protein CYMTET_19915 [Cymbomonas tetramitiformis]|uniref:Ion transport domain-containing protein n=1 Tax=Cymbomonas tetramitiformis TaxID=36881 RepID=A0AAE0L4U0_9CHLO|nr:hypothetical protein CYMTET_19915 [Cymbomonas tetramitiformis]
MAAVVVATQKKKQRREALRHEGQLRYEERQSEKRELDRVRKSFPRLITATITARRLQEAFNQGHSISDGGTTQTSSAVSNVVADETPELSPESDEKAVYQVPSPEIMREKASSASVGEKPEVWTRSRGSILRAASQKVILEEEEARSNVKKFYDGDTCQIAVAVLILLNFFANAAEAQVPGEHEDVFVVFEYFFTLVFALELAVNLYAHWFKEFWQSGWNVFDFVVVTISLLSLSLQGLPGISTLRLMRAFRVFRLFKRLESLRKIIKALEEAIPGCSNAFAILVLVSGIYSILGVELFGEIMPKYFENFSVAMFTMFQIMTGDSWAEAIARPVIDERPGAGVFFFVSFYLISAIVLVNVVIAVLLEKMVDSDDPDNDSDFDIDLEEVFEEKKKADEDVDMMSIPQMEQRQSQLPGLLPVSSLGDVKTGHDHTDADDFPSARGKSRTDDLLTLLIAKIDRLDVHMSTLDDRMLTIEDTMKAAERRAKISGKSRASRVQL